jgi:hypothetical protein
MFLAIPSTKSGVGGGFIGNTFRSAALDLNFAATKTLVDSISNNNLVTFTRSSSGTYVDSDKLIKTATTDVPRFNHDPVTGESQGLLIEEQRTNEIRNSSAGGVVAGSPGTIPTGWGLQGNSDGWTRQVVGSGIDSENGLPYVEVRMYGTPVNAQLVLTFISQGIAAASNGQTWAASVYTKLTSGSLGDIIGYPAANLWNASLGYLSGLALSGTVPFTESWSRYASSATISEATAAFITWGVTFIATPGNTYDFTIRIAAPQLELGSFVTSWIPNTSTSAAATRSADVASITGASFSGWYNQNAGTVFASARRLTNAADFNRLLSFNAGTSANIWSMYSNADKYATYKKVGSGADNFLDGPTVGTLLNNHKTASATDTSTLVASTDGLLGTELTIAGMPTVNTLTIGSEYYPAFLSGTIGRLTYWRSRLPNSTLQAITQ